MKFKNLTIKPFDQLEAERIGIHIDWIEKDDKSKLYFGSLIVFVDTKKESNNGIVKHTTPIVLNCGGGADIDLVIGECVSTIDSMFACDILDKIYVIPQGTDGILGADEISLDTWMEENPKYLEYRNSDAINWKV